MSGEKASSAQRLARGCPRTTTPHLQPASHQHARPAGLRPSSRRRPHIRYPGGRGLRGRGGTAGPPGAGRGGDAAVAPAAAGRSPPGRGERAGAAGSGGSRRRREGGPSESSHTATAAGTSYWMYCFLHSGVMCAERCSANFILPSPLHSHPGPAATGGGGGGGNSDSDSSPHGPRRGAALLSSSAAAEVSSEPPSRHLPPPLHSPAPLAPPLDVIAMVTAYAAPTKGSGRGRGLVAFLLSPPLLGRTCWRHLP